MVLLPLRSSIVFDEARGGQAPTSTFGRGRARDPSIDVRVLATAARHLAAYGYEAMSVAAVAEEAGTTRQALYRRWAGKPELAAAAMAAYADHATDTRTADAFADLVAELTDFTKQGDTRPHQLSLVGTMLQDSVDADLRARYQAEVIAPRRRRLRHVLERAQRLDMIDTDADLDVAVTMCTGSWSCPRPPSARRPPGTGHCAQRHWSGTPLAAPHPPREPAERAASKSVQGQTQRTDAAASPPLRSTIDATRDVRPASRGTKPHRAELLGVSGRPPSWHTGGDPPGSFGRRVAFSLRHRAPRHGGDGRDAHASYP